MEDITIAKISLSAQTIPVSLNVLQEIINEKSNDLILWRGGQNFFNCLSFTNRFREVKFKFFINGKLHIIGSPKYVYKAIKNFEIILSDYVHPYEKGVWNLLKKNYSSHIDRYYLRL